jgi:acetylornithine deacetylase
VDPVDPVALARALIDIDSTTGREGAVGAFLAAELRTRGYHVVEQPVGADRFNLLATDDPPVVVLSTHLDCVPPFFPSREDSGLLYGRGSADAKGILAAQLAAIERLRAAGEQRVGLLLVVGEERGSDGARIADALACGSKYIVCGEPTGRRLARATRGVVRVRLGARGRAAHSSQPHLGESAIEKLLDALTLLRSIALPVDPDLGTTFYSVSLIEGGIAPNVIPPSASAEVMFRTVGPAADVIAALSPLRARVDVEEVLSVPPMRFASVPGFETATFPFTTDAPFFSRWGTPLLYGPGSAAVAHTDDEHVAMADLQAAVGDYAAIATALLASAAGESRAP